MKKKGTNRNEQEAQIQCEAQNCRVLTAAEKWRKRKVAESEKRKVKAKEEEEIQTEKEYLGEKNEVEEKKIKKAKK